MRQPMTVTMGLDRVAIEGRGDELAEQVQPGGSVEAALAAVLARIEPSSRLGAVTLRLSRPMVQLRRLEGLPPVSERQLQDLVATQSGRLFRAAVGGLVTGARWETKSPRRAVALVAATGIASHASLTRIAQEAGFPRVMITPAEESYRAIVLESGEQRGHASDAVRRRLVRVVMQLAACLFLLIAIAVVYLLRERSVLERRLAELSRPAAVAVSSRRTIEELERRRAAVERIESSRGLLLRQIARVATALPDSTFLTALSIGIHGGGKATARARHAAHAMAALADRTDEARGEAERSVQFVQDDTGRWEEFILLFRADVR